MDKTAFTLKFSIFITLSMVYSDAVDVCDTPHNPHTNWNPLDILSEKLPNAVPVDNYDFIIVGSGSSGAVIANRLSEVKNWRILLLEAGPPGDAITELPTIAPILQLTDYNWGYVTEPESHACLAMVEQRCACPRGKVVGGSSVLNYMTYTRGNPQDYDQWAALGNQGWSYNDVLPYFLKSENSQLTVCDEAYHNKEGYLNINHAFTSNLGHAFIAAGKGLGYDEVDYNGAQQIGFSRIQANIKRGLRNSAASAFLTPILDRGNLRILTNALATKILIDESNKVAYGVEYVWKNKTIQVTASKEVIISAGTFNSPQLLMLSGIGPESHLKELGIHSLSNLPVGQTLYDHPIFLGMLIFTNLVINTTNFTPPNVLQWYNTGEGPLSSVAGSDAIAFTKVNTSSNYPDVELLVHVGPFDSTFKQLTRFTDEFYEKMYSSLDSNVTTFKIIPVLLHPKSKGFLKLKSANPTDHPLIYMNYLTDPDGYDVKTLIGGIRKVQKLIQTPAFQKYKAQIYDKPFVGCENLEYDSDTYWECALRLVVSSMFHASTTCKMGPKGDPDAVVNHKLQVYGIRNLRVADASVFPVTISGHTNAPAIMVGEKASDLIKKDWLASEHFSCT